MRWLDVTTWAAWMVVMVGGLAVPPSTDTTRSNGTWRGNLGSIPSPTMVTWLVDGTNLMCSRNVPNDRETILRELSKMASPRCDGSGAWNECQRDNGNRHTTTTTKEIPLISNVVVVFDGIEDEDSDRTVVDTDRWLEWTVTDGRNRVKDRADDWIVEHAIPRLQTIIDRRLDDDEGSTKVNLVSADVDLQKRVRATRILNGGSLVHPPRFWKDYLPILQEKQQCKQHGH